MFRHDARTAGAVLDSGFLRVRILPDGRCVFDRLADVHALRLARVSNAAPAELRHAAAPMDDYGALLLFVAQFGLGLETLEAGK